MASRLLPNLASTIHYCQIEIGIQGASVCKISINSTLTNRLNWLKRTHQSSAILIMITAWI